MPTGQRPLPPPHCAHLTVFGTVQGTPVANTFWVRNGNAAEPSQADFTSFCSDFGAAYLTHFLPHLSSNLTISETSALYYEAGGASLSAAVSHNNAGGEATGPLPANCAMAVGWRVQAHYRGGHPRAYLPAIPANKMADSRQVSATYASALALAAKNFHTFVNDISHGLFASSKLGLVSFVFRKEWRSPPIFRDFVLDSAHCDPRIDSMRRRLGRDIPP